MRRHVNERHLPKDAPHAKEDMDLHRRALGVMPGGVNSPVRAWGAVGGTPIYVQRAQGAYLFSEDGHKYIDLVNGWGPALLGHAHPVVVEAVQKAATRGLSWGTTTRQEVEMAERIQSMMPSLEKLRMVNSGTEATMAALRLARAYTRRNKLLKFEGCYHGHADPFLVSAGSGLASTARPTSAGLNPNVVQDTLVVPYNDLRGVQEVFARYPRQIAAVMVEPVAGNMGCVPPKEGFLAGLRSLCTEHDSLLIFDEVMTAFRIAAGGAQAHYQVIPDLTTIGKVVGGGLPVGGYGGRADIMQHISPEGPVYQAGTLSGNPMTMAAGLATLDYLQQHPETYLNIQQIAQSLCNGMQKTLRDLQLPYKVQGVQSMFSLFFTPQKVYNFQDAQQSNTRAFAHYFHEMKKRYIYLPPSAFEANFVSLALTPDMVKQLLDAQHASLQALMVQGIV